MAWLDLIGMIVAYLGVAIGAMVVLGWLFGG